MADNTRLSDLSGSGATRELHESIKQQIASTDRQSVVITRLTVFMAVLAAIQAVAAVIQIIPLLQPDKSKDVVTNQAQAAQTASIQTSSPPTNQTASSAAKRP